MIGIKEKKMGRKGVSKRKPKKNKSNVGSSDVRQVEGTSVQALVKDKDTSINRGGTDPHTGSNKKGKKGKR